MQENNQSGSQKKEPKCIPLGELIRISRKQNNNNNKSQPDDELVMFVICVSDVLLGLNLLDLLGQ